MGEAREAEEGGDICIIMANSSMAETNKVLEKKKDIFQYCNFGDS